MRYASAVAALVLCCVPLWSRAGDTQSATLSEEEQKAGWKLVFDGVSTKGWRGLGSKEFPAQGWDVVDGCLHHKPKGGGGDITLSDAYESFELSVEWKIAPNGNSGIKYRVAESPGQKSAFGPEYQALDAGHADAKKSKNSVASLYDVLAPSEKTKAQPAGEFNQTRIVVQGEHAEHWLNGEKVLEFEFGSDAWKAAVAQSKFKNNPKFAAAKRGQICFQDHGDEVWFRNIRIRELPAK